MPILKLANCLAMAFVLGAALPAGSTPLAPAAEPFDYFRNSWNVIGLKDYRDGTRVTPQNELLLASQARLRISCGSSPKPLGRKPVKKLLDGWLPVILLTTEEESVRYDFTLWASPLPSVNDWRAAYDGPSEGENYLNWIQVRATNRGAAPAEARVELVESSGATSALLASWQAALEPGGSAGTAFCVPFAWVKGAAAFEKDAPVWLDRTVSWWRGLLERGARIEVPCEKSTQALRAAHVCQLIASDGGVLRGGEGFYDEFYIRDGGYQILELEEAGLFEAAGKALEAYLGAQRPDGRFETQKDQLDANGQALWVLWQYGKITGDREWLKKAYPPMRRAVEWLVKARREAPAGSPFEGLLPAAPADGEFLWDGKHHIAGYDFWNRRGLLCTADAARELGEEADAKEWEREAEDYRRAIDAAWKRTGLPYFPPSWEKEGTHWGNTETLWPTEIFAPDDPRVGATLAEVRERHGGGFVEGTIRWTGQPNVIHPYLSSYTTMASLIRGEDEKFTEEFYWYLLHSSASHAFPEGIYYKRRYAWSETIPHVTGAANFAFLLRHALVHERGEELHLLLGAPDGWLADGKEIRVENAPTHFGPMSFRARGRKDQVEVQLEPPRRRPPKRLVLHLPRSRPPAAAPEGVAVQLRADQSRRWDFPAVVELYRKLPAAQEKPIPGLVPLPLPKALAAEECRLLDLAPLANTDPFTAPFGVPRPGKFLFTGMPVGVQTAGSIPFRILDPAKNEGRGLVVLQGADASAGFPREVTLAVGERGRGLFFLGNVHGWSPDDEGAGEQGAVAEYVIQYADGETQTVPLISHRTADDWAGEPDASEAHAAWRGDPWHLNVLGAELRPVTIDKILFRDLGTAAAPVLAAVTLVREQTLHLRPGPQLFIDDRLIASQFNLKRAVNQPARLPEPVVTGPEDKCFQPYVTVIRDPETRRFRIWYGVPENAGQSHLSTMESEDGIRWIRPHRVLADPARIQFGASVIDEGPGCADPSRRYKYGWWNDGGLQVAASPDGLEWKPMAPGVVLPHNHDINCIAWDPIRKRYLALVSIYMTDPAWTGHRRIPHMSVSDDLIRWKKPWRIISPDGRDEGETQFYCMAGVLARGDLLIGMLKVLRDELKASTAPPDGYGIGYTVLAWSRDGERWERDREPFMDRSPRPGWDHAMTWADCQLPVGDEITIYYGGYARGHKVERFTERQIGLARMPRDRYVSRDAGDSPGSLQTPLVILEASRLTVNARVDGELRVGLLDAGLQEERGRELEGFGAMDCRPIRGDSLAHPVEWKRPLAAVRGRPVSIKFTLRNARLYAFDLAEVQRP